MNKRTNALALVVAFVTTMCVGFISPVGAATATNLIADPSAEQVTAPGGNWLDGSYSSSGTDVSADYTLATSTDIHSGTKSLETKVTKAFDGDAEWYFKPVTVTGGATYTISLWYKATAATEIDGFFTADGKSTYPWLADLPAASVWTQKTLNITMPAGTNVTASFGVPVVNVNDVLTDDYSLTAAAVTPPPPPPTPGQFTNGGAETLDSAGNPTPWVADSWSNTTGGITAASSVLSTGAHSGSHALMTKVSGYKSGAAEWMQTIPVTAGQTYKVTGWVATNVTPTVAAPLQIGAMGANASGEMNNTWSTIANLGAANNPATSKAPTGASSYTQYTGSFTAPAGATGEEIMVPLSANGWVAIDDFSSSLVSAPAQFPQGMVTVALDDGWASQSTNGFAIRQKYGIKATDYIIGNAIGTSDYMTKAQIKSMLTFGDELGNHTWDHPDAPKTLNTMTAAQIDTEFSKDQSTIKTDFGVTPTTCAYPEGSYNATVLNEAAKYFTGGCRSVDNTSDTYSANTPAMFVADPQYKYRVMDVNIVGALAAKKGQPAVAATPVAYVKAAIDYAKANKVWIVLTYHEITKPGQKTAGGDQYYTTTTDFDAEMAYLKASGVSTPTMASAFATVAQTK